MFILDPGSRLFPIPDLTKTRSGHQFHKIENYFFFSNRYRRNRFESIDTNLSIFTQNVIKLSELWVGPGIRKKIFLDPGVKKAQDPGSGFATLFRSYAFFPLRGEVRMRTFFTFIQFLFSQKLVKEHNSCLHAFRVDINISHFSTPHLWQDFLFFYRSQAKILRT
jgi:hypothetical protein